jgi:hypothetical protein
MILDLNQHSVKHDGNWNTLADFAGHESAKCHLQDE